MIPTKAGRDTVCECGHWWEEHIEPRDGNAPLCEGCVAGRLGGAEHGFVFDPTYNTPDEIAGPRRRPGTLAAVGQGSLWPGEDGRMDALIIVAVILSLNLLQYLDRRAGRVRWED